MDLVKREKELSWETHPYLPIQIKRNSLVPMLSSGPGGRQLELL
jgi:hypothetical protein